MTHHNTKPLTARAFMASFSAAGRISNIAGPKTCVACKSKPARWDSLYCSESCKQQFHQDIREGK